MNNESASRGTPGVSALDLPNLLFVTVTPALVTFGASYLPARRATRVDPMIALART